MTSDVFNCWPLVVAMEDCFVPGEAPLVLNAVSQLDLETLATAFACEAYIAECDALDRTN